MTRAENVSVLCFLLPCCLQALSQVSRYLGYPTTRGFLGDYFLSMVANWLDKGEQLAEFPYQLLGDESKEEFFQYVMGYVMG